MTLTLLLFLTIVAFLLGLLVWALGKPKPAGHVVHEPASLEQAGRRHATYLALIRQALAPTDLVFLTRLGSHQLAMRVRKERRSVVLSYLASLREDHSRLLRIAKVVAALSPAVAPSQELKRVWLSAQFWLRYQILCAGVYVGLLSLRNLDGLSRMVSELAVRVETAMTELGERAALAAKLASSLDRGGDVA